MNACIYDTECELGESLWGLYGERIIPSIQKRMILSVMQDYFDANLVVNVSVQLCHGYMVYNLKGYQDVLIDHIDYIKVVMMQFTRSK